MSCEGNILSVTAFSALLRQLKKFTIRWIALPSFRTTDPSAEQPRPRAL